MTPIDLGGEDENLFAEPFVPTWIHLSQQLW